MIPDTKIFVAELQTRNFEFHAYGNSKEEAVELMKKVWKAHCKQFPDAMKGFLRKYPEEIELYEVEIGGVYRDRQRLDI